MAKRHSKTGARLARQLRLIVVKKNSSDAEFSPIAVSDAPVILDMLLERDADGETWFDREMREVGHVRLGDIASEAEARAVGARWGIYRRMVATRRALFKHAVDIRRGEARLPAGASRGRSWLEHGLFYVRSSGLIHREGDHRLRGALVHEYTVRCLFCRADLATQASGANLGKADMRRCDEHAEVCAFRFLIDNVIPKWQDGDA